MSFTLSILHPVHRLSLLCTCPTHLNLSSLILSAQPELFLLSAVRLHNKDSVDDHTYADRHTRAVPLSVIYLTKHSILFYFILHVIPFILFYSTDFLNFCCL